MGAADRDGCGGGRRSRSTDRIEKIDNPTLAYTTILANVPVQSKASEQATCIAVATAGVPALEVSLPAIAGNWPETAMA